MIYMTCSDLAPVLSSFFLVSTQCFVAGFLSVSDPVDLTFVASLWMPLLQNFLQHFLVKPHFTYDSSRETCR